MSRLVSIVVSAALVACGTSGGRTSAPVETTSREVVNLRAFARLYGVVRWFHPSDEAAEADWDAFAIRGVGIVRGIADQKALQQALDAIVRPVGAGIVIGSAAEVANVPPPVSAKGELVAWQHVGPGFDGGGGGGTYQSKRANRAAFLRIGAGWGAFSHVIEGAALRGKRVRLRVELRAGKDSRVGAWLRVDRPDDAPGFFDNMEDRLVTRSTWERRTIEGDVAADAVRVVVGGLLMGNDGWFDDFVLEVADGNGGWSPVVLADGDFEHGREAWSVDGKVRPAYELVVEAKAHGASTAGHLRAPRTPIVGGPFGAPPADGEVALVDLGDGLWARVPIALTSVAGHTVPETGTRTFAAVIGEPTTEPRVDDTAIADVIVAWNVFAHFYPYLDVIATDWHAYLDEALAAAVGAHADATKLHDVLSDLIVAAEDGHGGITTDPPRVPLPAALDAVEDKIVVVVSGDAALAPGDEIVSIDGVAAAAALDAERSRHSGSPQWRTHMSLRALGAGPEGSAAAIELRRSGAPMSAVVKRASPPELYTYPPVGEVEPGVWLVDMARAETADINARMDVLATAKGIVFDMRGYPNGTHAVLTHLLDAPEHDRWMHVPQIIRPNLPGQPLPEPTWHSVGWNMEPIAPRFAGKVVFMTGPGAISYAESVMGYVEMLKLPVVGAATAGTNGNVRVVGLPSGAGFAFTGMKVTRHDGTRSHLEGIRPTVPVARTIAGVTAGKDEVLERALSLVR